MIADPTNLAETRLLFLSNFDYSLLSSFEFIVSFFFGLTIFWLSRVTSPFYFFLDESDSVELSSSGSFDVWVELAFESVEFVCWRSLLWDA